MSWRNTLFVWRGSLAGAEWTGHWVGVDSPDAARVAPPSAQEFADSPNAFAVTLEAVGDVQTFACEPGAEVSATAGKGYMLDQGDGLGHSFHQDDEHCIRFSHSADGAVMAAARGRNEFAPFVALGHVTGTELVLARRYLDEKDARADWTLEEVEAAGNGAKGAAPWQTQALHAKIQRKPKAPKRKAGDAQVASPAHKKGKTLASPAGPGKFVRHVVLFKFKPDVAPETLDAAKASLMQLKVKVPGVEKISFGASFTHDRAQGYTHALVVDLTDTAALEAYASHAEHLKVVNSLLKPNLEAPPLAMDYLF